jgi:putative thioredoxin
MTTDSTVLEVTDSTFATEVLERSHATPVVVDFWAPWCGPCRVLGPIIERVAGEHAGDVTLVKLNTDENPRAASQYRIQSIPAVKAFVDGKVAAEFIGAVPEQQVRAFFAKVVPPPEARAVREAEALAATDPPEAERRLRAVLATAPKYVDATVALASLLLARGATDEAAMLVEHALPDPRAKALGHRVFLAQFAARHAHDDLAGEAQRNPGDPAARYRIGVMLASREQYEPALEELLASVRLDKSFADQAARKAMLAVFDIVGVNDMTREYQRRLASAIF